MGRIFATTAEKYLGKSLVVVNKAGASGVIGKELGFDAQVYQMLGLAALPED